MRDKIRRVVLTALNVNLRLYCQCVGKGSCLLGGSLFILGDIFDQVILGSSSYLSALKGFHRHIVVAVGSHCCIVAVHSCFNRWLCSMLQVQVELIILACDPNRKMVPPHQSVIRTFHIPSSCDA
jgi:hypothetical protein